MAKMRRDVPKVRYRAPVPVGVEVMTFAQLRDIAPPGYLQTPQRPDFHVLLLGTAGRAAHTVDFRSYQVGSGRAVWVRPGQVQRFDLGEPGVHGEVVLFEPDFLIPGTDAARIADDRFHSVEFTSSPSWGVRLDASRSALTDEYVAVRRAADAGESPNAETLRHLLSVLILRLTAADGRGAPPRSEAVLHDRFRDLLERDFAEAHDVDHYARELGYSARTLARSTRAISGQTPKGMLQTRLALEAGRLLAHSDLSVGEIAANLSFRDASNFSAFFARQVGERPLAFRRSQRAQR